MNIHGRIIELLELYPVYRDGINQLCCRIWSEEMYAMGFGNEMFITLYEHGELTTESTITRLHRIILASDKYKHLRGELYGKSHAHCE